MHIREGFKLKLTTYCKFPASSIAKHRNRLTMDYRRIAKIWVIVALVGIWFSLPQSDAQQLSSEVLEKINVDTYLQNKRLVEYHIKCIGYSGPCDKIGNEIKRLMHAVRFTGGVTTTDCKACTEVQKQKLGKIAAFLQKNYPAEWQQVTKALQSK